VRIIAKKRLEAGKAQSSRGEKMGSFVNFQIKKIVAKQREKGV